MEENKNSWAPVSYYSRVTLESLWVRYTPKGWLICGDRGTVTLLPSSSKTSDSGPQASVSGGKEASAWAGPLKDMEGVTFRVQILSPFFLPWNSGTLGPHLLSRVGTEDFSMWWIQNMIYVLNSKQQSLLQLLKESCLGGFYQATTKAQTTIITKPENC